MRLSQTELDLIADMYKTRRKLGWSQVRLAEHLNVCRQYITNVENKRRTIPKPMQQRIALFVYENNK